TGEGLDIHVGAHENHIAKAVACRELRASLRRMAHAQPRQRRGEEGRPAAIGDQVDVLEVVPELGSRRPLQGDHRPVAEIVRERSHLYGPLVKGHGVAVDIEDDLSVASPGESRVDRLQETALRFTDLPVVAGLAEFLNGIHVAWTRLLYGARTIGGNEIAPAP